MTPDQMKEWQEHMDFTPLEAAEALGMHVNTYLNYRRGYRYMSQGEKRDVGIPDTVSLACGALALDLEDYDDLDLKDL